MEDKPDNRAGWRSDSRQRRIKFPLQTIFEDKSSKTEGNKDRVKNNRWGSLLGALCLQYCCSPAIQVMGCSAKDHLLHQLELGLHIIS